MNTYHLDPSAVLDFSWDWTDWLSAGETITSQTVTTSNPGIAINTVSHLSGVVTAWLGTASTGLKIVTCQVSTNQGRTDQRSIRVDVIDR